MPLNKETKPIAHDVWEPISSVKDVNLLTAYTSDFIYSGEDLSTLIKSCW